MLPPFNKKNYPGLGSLSPQAKAMAQSKAQLENEKMFLQDLPSKPSSKAAKGLLAAMEKTFDNLKELAQEMAIPIVVPTQKTSTTTEPPPYYIVNPGAPHDGTPLQTVTLTHTPAPPVPYVVMGGQIDPVKAKEAGLFGPMGVSMGVMPGYLEELSKPEEANVAKAQKKSKKGKPKPKQKADMIFQWPFTSGQEVAGMKAQYITYLRADQSVTCNCPGWIFKKKGATERSCKHTRSVEAEAKVIFKKWKSGEALPQISNPAYQDSGIPGTVKSEMSLKYERKMDI